LCLLKSAPEKENVVRVVLGQENHEYGFHAPKDQTARFISDI